MKTRYSFALVIVSTLLGSSSAIYAQASNSYVMKLSTATINGIQNEWMKRFAAVVERDFGRPYQDRALSG